jgi:hypothetical protein
MRCVCKHTKDVHPAEPVGGCLFCECWQFREYKKLTKTDKNKLFHDLVATVRALANPCESASRDRFSYVCTHLYKDKPDRWCRQCKASLVTDRVFCARLWFTAEERKKFWKPKKRKVAKKDIENAVEFWHTHNTGMSLSRFLGMSKEEYSAFVENRP